MFAHGRPTFAKASARQTIQPHALIYRSQFNRKESPHRIRKLLNFIVSNSIWDGKNLQVEFMQPFDMIAENIEMVIGKSGTQSVELPVSENWLRGLGSNQRPIG